VTGIQIVGKFVMHAILEQELDGAEGVLGEVSPEVLRILDPSPQIGYGEIGQCWHTGHGRILLSLVEWGEVRVRPSYWRALR
jgi:hypothetical protein